MADTLDGRIVFATQLGEEINLVETDVIRFYT